jgi:acetolactate synthase-1/2/3 large subunit
MTVSDFLVEELVKNKVTDVFGIPGGAVLDFLYSLEKKKPLIQPRLSFHEQAAVFSAAGYAQLTGGLGVAYATRGPGITNTVTAIADAYYDSIPLLIVTAHAYSGKRSLRRIDENQELDSRDILKPIIKYSARIESAEQAVFEVKKAIKIALGGRKGPVLLDFNKAILKANITDLVYSENYEVNEDGSLQVSDVELLKNKIHQSKRPLILIGDGIRQSNSINEFNEFVKDKNIPILSSRYTQDIAASNPNYFGYIGSHGLRYSNFILSKSDLIIAIGNQLNFPLESKTFGKIIQNTEFIRFEIDQNEAHRSIPNVTTIKTSLTNLFKIDSFKLIQIVDHDNWVGTCNRIKDQLFDFDVNQPVELISIALRCISQDYSITSDVGNNEFWLCRAYAYTKSTQRVLYSKSFGAMGCSIPKAIGVWHRTLKPVVSFNGDQAIQMNIQELHYIGKHQLPIAVVVINNYSSGMIKTRQINSFGSKYLQTTLDSGYSQPDFEKIAYSYGIKYVALNNNDDLEGLLGGIKQPIFIEVKVSDEFDLYPSIKLGDDMQNMYPYIDKTLYDSINDL